MNVLLPDVLELFGVIIVLLESLAFFALFHHSCFPTHQLIFPFTNHQCLRSPSTAKETKQNTRDGGQRPDLLFASGEAEFVFSFRRFLQVLAASSGSEWRRRRLLTPETRACERVRGCARACCVRWLRACVVA